MFNTSSKDKNEPDSNIPSRLLPLEGAYNVRDLGGYPAADKKTVKWRKVIRSGDLNLLTNKSLSYLDAIPLRVFVDFRGADEIETAPDKTPRSLEKQLFLPIETASVTGFGRVTPDLAETILVEANKHFVRNSQDTYKAFFRLLMDEENTPLLFHCSAGKDRTGFAAAMFLASLGVDRDTIVADYLLTNECLKDKYASIVLRMPVLKPLFEVREEYIRAVFEVIDNEYGGTECYLINQLQVDLKKMRTIYTE